jgi:hypothetical protein
MSEETNKERLEVVLAKRKSLVDVAKQIDLISTEAVELFDQSGSFGKEIAVAQAVGDMRLMLTDDVMKPVMALMNTPLGFMTDKDPSRPAWDKKANGYVTPEPYPVEVVREAVIEAKLRGAHLVGNEFNIISKRFYAAKNFLERKVKELTKGTIEICTHAPVLSADGTSAKAKCSARWEFSGEKFDIGLRPEDQCEFVIRVNASMGADAIVGKAERKLYARIYKRLTGRPILDGDTDETPEKNVTPTAEKPTFKSETTPQPETASKPVTKDELFSK